MQLRRVLPVLKWFGTGAQIAGALGMASHLVDPVVAYGIMASGSVCWIIAGAVMKEPSLVALNLAFTTINLIGIARWG
ncbi:MAG: hypothetical protein JWM33_2259 [Caulobacteraceae bacterium]|nr:hypothetical protein [Caulobacteraceae bacterium]